MKMPIAMLIFMTWLLATSYADPAALPSARARTTSRESRGTLYSYAYAVDVPEYRNFYDHEEGRTGDVTQGRFRVALPDNRLQTVTYRAGRKGYSAKISYDRHPDFQSLRAAVGPIREAPEIGQPVVTSRRRGENWKDRENHSDNEILSVEPSPHFQSQRPTTTTTRRPRPRPSTTSRPRPTTSRRPSPSPRPTTTNRPHRFGATSRPDFKVTRPKNSGPVAQKLVASPQPTQRTTTTTARPQLTSAPLLPSIRPGPNMPEDASLFVSTEGLGDPDILNRLIEAIRRKVEREQALNATHHDVDDEGDDDDDEDHSHEKDKPRYSISDRADVVERLRAIVHSVPIHKI